MAMAEEHLKPPVAELEGFFAAQAKLPASLCDVVLKVGAVKIPTSKYLLAAHSGFCRDYFEQEGSLAKGPGRSVIPLEDLDADVVKDLVAALLTTRIQLTEEKLEGFCKAVDMLDLSIFKLCILDACKDMGLQKAKAGKEAHAAFLTKLAALGERYHFDALVRYAVHVGSHEPSLIQASAWPLGAFSEAWEGVTQRLIDMEEFFGGEKSYVYFPQCQRTIIYARGIICTGNTVCSECMEKMKPSKTAKCAVFHRPPSKCTCVL